MKPSTLARVLRAIYAMRTPYRAREWNPDAWELWFAWRPVMVLRFAWRPVMVLRFVRKYPNVPGKFKTLPITFTTVWTKHRVWLQWVQRRAFSTKPGAGTAYAYQELPTPSKVKG